MIDSVSSGLPTEHTVQDHVIDSGEKWRKSYNDILFNLVVIRSSSALPSVSDLRDLGLSYSRMKAQLDSFDLQVSRMKNWDSNDVYDIIAMMGKVSDYKKLVGRMGKVIEALEERGPLLQLPIATSHAHRLRRKYSFHVTYRDDSTVKEATALINNWQNAYNGLIDKLHAIQPLQSLPPSKTLRDLYNSYDSTRKRFNALEKHYIEIIKA
jgi:hypothetical protein